MAFLNSVSLGWLIVLGGEVEAAGSGMLFNPVLRKSCTSRSAEYSGKEDNVMQLDITQ